MVASNTRQDYALNKFDLWALSLSSGPPDNAVIKLNIMTLISINFFFVASIERAEAKATIWWSFDRILCLPVPVDEPSRPVRHSRHQKVWMEARDGAVIVSHSVSRVPIRDKMSINSINPILIEFWWRCDREKDLVIALAAPFLIFWKMYCVHL